MKRKIIEINEDKCNGCAQCIPDCPEGALQVIDGKARLVSDLFCDGLGACIKNCPRGAMQVIEREAEPYDEYKVMMNIIKSGPNVIKAHLEHLKDHGEAKLYEQAVDYLKRNNMPVPQLSDKAPCGCAGMIQKNIKRGALEQDSVNNNYKPTSTSQLNNWPIQLRLLNTNAPYLENADLVIAADCSAFSYADFHRKFLKDKVLIIFCPKLDENLESYIDKLSEIFKSKKINSLSIVHMQVPCCGGVEAVVKKAMSKAYVNIIIKDYTISIEGELV